MELKRKAGRPRKPSITTASLKEIRKFFANYPTLRAGAHVLNISEQNASSWLNAHWRPSVESAIKMQEISKGQVNADIILSPDGVFKSKTLSEHILKNFISVKARLLGVSEDFYLTAYIPIALQDIMQSSALDLDDIQSLVCMLGGTVEYWLDVKDNLEKNNKNNG